jgi:hypothetical protein
MNRHTIRQHLANAHTAKAIISSKLGFISPQSGYGDLEALSTFIDAVITEVDRLDHELRRARDVADDLRMAAQDAANRTADTARALDVIGEAMANYRPEPRANVIPIRRQIELVASNDGAA